jgi:hypothetical protein
MAGGHCLKAVVTNQERDKGFSNRDETEMRSCASRETEKRDETRN